MRRPLLWFLISATIDDESIPPERNEPRGTSATISSLTTRSSVSRTCSFHHASLLPSSMVSNEMSHHSQTVTSLSRHFTKWPGGTVLIPRKSVFGSGAHKNVRNWCSASRSSSALTKVLARIDLTSEAKTSEAL